MAALNFPNSPTVNDEVELGGKTYKWDGVKWLMIKVVTPAEQALAPTITFVSSTTTSITFTVKNNDAQTAVILWEQNDTTPDANSLELAAGVTSSNLTISGLTEGDLLTIYATANVTNKIKSNVAELVRGTTLATPTITQVSKDSESITFTVRNNSTQALDVTYGLTSPPTTTTVALNANTTSANQTIGGLDADTSYTVFAQAKKTNHTDSVIASSTVTTDTGEFVLYDAGNEFTSITGNWKSMDSNPEGGWVLSPITKLAQDIRLDATTFNRRSIMVTTNLINFTPYTTLNVLYSFKSNENSHNIRVMTTNTSITSLAAQTVASISADNPKGTFVQNTLDVSSVNGNFYPVIWTQNVGERAIADVRKVWLT